MDRLRQLENLIRELEKLFVLLVLFFDRLPLLVGDHLTLGVGRVIRAGVQPISWVALACELRRDWSCEETVADVMEIVLTERLLQT